LAELEQRQIQAQANAKTVEVSPKYESARSGYLPTTS
jgi:hypothetical protein